MAKTTATPVAVRTGASRGAVASPASPAVAASPRTDKFDSGGASRATAPWTRDFTHVPVQSTSTSTSNANANANAHALHDTARAGLSGNARPLPFLSTLQRLFGRHDLTRVKAYVGGPAKEASAGLRATAYTVGDRVAFREPPTLQTAAHEAAHVVQQHAAPRRLDAIGQRHDRFERHADAVADAVAAGHSAEALLDSSAPSTAGPRGATLGGAPPVGAAPIGASPSLQLQDDPNTTSERYEAQRPGAPPPSGGMAGAGMNNRGRCVLRNGTLQWSLEPRVGSVNARIEFIPNAAVAAASRTISFVQTVTTSDTTGGFLGFGATTWRGRTGVDALPSDRDPFYGAQWNQNAGGWANEPNSTQARPGDYENRPGPPREGSRPFTASTGSAVINDSPMLPIRQSKSFETAAVVLETGQVLCSLRWIIQRFPAGLLNQGSSTIVRSATCSDAPTAGVATALGEYYSETPTVTGFAEGSADLPPGHQAQLASTLSRLRADTERAVVVGGAANANEPDPAGLSRRRAESVRAYLVSEGIAQSRIQIEAYGSEWARVPVASPGAAEANRRVQIKVR